MFVRLSPQTARAGQGWPVLSSAARRSLATVAAAAASSPGEVTTATPRQVHRLDLGMYLHGDEQQKHRFCAQLSHELRYTGFAKLSNHGIAKSDIDEVFHWNKSFFDLPLEAKNKAAHPAQPNPHRGYSYVGQEILSKVKDFEKGERDAVAVHDIKESYDQGPSQDELYPNRWPEEEDIPGFRPFMESFFDKCHEVHLHLLEALARGLEKPPTFFQDLCRINTSELRLNHYPACSAAQLRAGADGGATAMRISEHTDFGTVTLLFQDSSGGLEIEDQEARGTYFPVAPEDKYELIVNIGDCLQRWTNDTLRSTSHRVTLPPDAGDWLDSRYSVAYFAKPNRDQTVGSLPDFVAPGQSPKYDHVSAWEYNQQKLTRTYAY